MTVLMIDGRRNDYSANNLVNKTMTVGELVSYLDGFDSDMPVLLSNDNGYTYGKITDNGIWEEEVEEDEEEDE
jgi:hypothetical protein